MGSGALRRENQQSTFAHMHTSSSHSTTSPWSPIPYPHCVSTATTCPEVSESRHYVAVTGVGGVHDADNHQSWATFGCAGTGVSTGPATSSSIGAMAGPSLAGTASQGAGRGPAGVAASPAGQPSDHP